MPRRNRHGAVRYDGTPVASGKRWTPEEDAVLVENYPTHGCAWGGWWCNGGTLLPGRSIGAMGMRASKLGCRTFTMRQRHAWSDEEDGQLLIALNGVAAKLGRSPAACLTRMCSLRTRSEAARRRRRVKFEDAPPLDSGSEEAGLVG